MRSPRDAAPPTRLRHVHTVATACARPATGSPPPPHRRTPRAVNAQAAPTSSAPPLPPLSPLFVGFTRFDRDAPRRRVVSAAALADEAAVDFDDAFLDDDWAAAAGADAGEPAPGPPVAILAGFRDGEAALVRRALDEAGLSALPVVPASHALLLLPARDALYTAREPDWSAPRAADAPRGGGVGARRAVLFGGVTLADQAAALAAIDGAVGGGSVVPAEADELTWASVRAGDVLAAAVKDVDADDAAAARARRRGPPIVDALPPVEDVLAAAGVDVHGAPGGGGVVVDVEPAATAAEEAPAEPQPPPPPPHVPPDWRDQAAAGGADFLSSIAGNAVGARAGAAPAWQGGDDENDDDDDAAAAPPEAGLMPGGGGSVLDAVAAGQAAPPPLVEGEGDDANTYLQAAMAADAAAARAGAGAPPRRERLAPSPPAPDATDVFMRGPSAAADAGAAGPSTTDAAGPSPTKPPPVTLAPVGLDPGEDAAHDAVVADLDAKFRALPASDKAALAARMAEEARSPTRDAIAAAIACGLSADEIKAMVDDAAAAAAEAGGLAVPWASMAKMGLDPTPEEAAAAEEADDE